MPKNTQKSVQNSTEAKAENIHGASSYTGASKPFRGHQRKLTPVDLNRVCETFTERDAAFLADLHTRYGDKPFKRFDCDAGNLARAIGYGHITYVSGDLALRDCVFQLTAKAVKLHTPQSATPSAK